MKLCKFCNTEKPETTDFFQKNNKGKKGLHSKCKECVNIYSKRHYHEGYKVIKKSKDILNHEQKKHKNRSNMLWTYYRLREDDYRKILDKQKGCCAICEKSLINPKYSNNDCHVDHCHKTGIVRGLLCGNCNALIGYAKENINILNNSIKYLKESINGD